MRAVSSCEFERLYLRLFLPALRHGTRGARKRYAGLSGGGPEGDGRLHRAWRRCAATGPASPEQVQRELYDRLFADRPVDDYLRQVVADLRRGASTTLLVYRKSLRKPPDEYTATTPPHVAAARKMPRQRAGASPT